MRTTLNLDDDVAARLVEHARRDGRSVSSAANKLLRAALRDSEGPTTLPVYEPEVFDTGTPLIDVTDVGASLEVLDDHP